MNLITKRIRGMQDLIPGMSEKWDAVEKILKSEASIYGFKNIRTPVLESTELFRRSSGEESDVVQKEMYTFDDKGGRSVTLRPEGTAGVVRAVLENGLHNNSLPLKLMYVASCYRYEKPQSGRLREFFQFGAEIFGTASYLADAELIILANSIFKRLGVENIKLEINSIGCSNCRKNYVSAIKDYFKNHENNLCETCRGRLEKNPMRIFDCKDDGCHKICIKAPIILDYICDECREHFENLKKHLSSADIQYAVNPKIVRGLDYYCRTVFEFVYHGVEVPITVCGGGRYDGLSNDLGGPDLPALGFGIGIERLLAILEEQEIAHERESYPEVFIACADESARPFASELCQKLRNNSISALIDISGKKVKSQMKYADKVGAKYVIVIGNDEMNLMNGTLKNMKDGTAFRINLKENFVRDFIFITSK